MMQNIIILVENRKTLPKTVFSKLNSHFGINFCCNNHVKLHVLTHDEYANIHPLRMDSLKITADTIFLEEGKSYYGIVFSNILTLKYILSKVIMKQQKFAVSYYGEVVTKIEYAWKFNSYSFSGYKYNWTSDYKKACSDAIIRKSKVVAINKFAKNPYGEVNITQ